MTTLPTPTVPDAHLLALPSERWQWLVALTLGTLGLGMCTAVLTGMVGRTAATEAETAPPAVLEAARTPVPGPPAAASVLAGAAGGERTSGGPREGRAQTAHLARREPPPRPTAFEAQATIARRGLTTSWLADQTETAISTRWMEGFYPIYAIAQSTFGVNWLLIASIHKQESAFSTAPSTYHGLNFVGCCGGPMQFNVTNGPVSTWDLVSDSYLYGQRPAPYDHMTVTHPSIYDDFDAIMAAAHLLSADGATYELNGAAWDAAYDYYGHDANGVSYADEVLARAIGWSQHGFCINCGVEGAGGSRTRSLRRPRAPLAAHRHNRPRPGEIAPAASLRLRPPLLGARCPVDQERPRAMAD